ncbi:thiamine pyrophosphate-binding protein [Oryzicola mucosus]|uniref:thiamine pyrophosphate-binding protein n=1 Tax=Oryzicola mucosus TaxID=2767425 RepID=UPI001AEF09BE|nr:thiamine pyrophosphate-binding protein [Oryzicola mucosus]
MERDIAVKSADDQMKWGSDVAAELLRRLGIEYVCINPGSSFRGLHDSMVNYLGNEEPSLILSLHEESVVAIAHGYAKVAGKPMGVILHSNVGLMLGMMSIFNAWCDRVPMLILGATGAVDTAVRRNWIDWLHTSRDQGALIRNFVKWDEQPTSPTATVDAMLRAYMHACTAPCGPSYVALDRRLQEDALSKPIEIPDISLFAPPHPPKPATEVVERAATLLAQAQRPVILIGRASHAPAAWHARVALAEMLGARVITDLRFGASFPTTHPLHGAPPDLFLTPRNRRILADADAVLSLGWDDLADVMRQAFTDSGRRATVIHASVDYQVHNGWSGDHQRLAAIDVRIACEADVLLEPLLHALSKHDMPPKPATTDRTASAPQPGPIVAGRKPTLLDIGQALLAARADRKLCLARVPLNWPAGAYPFEDPMDYLGYDGGGGVGSGPGMTIGSALALKGSGRIPVGLMGDGEFIGGATALWTAAHYRIPVLIVVANNRSYYTDEVQQEAVAVARGRPPENKWIGQRIDEPAINIAGLASDLGFATEPVVRDSGDIQTALERGLDEVEKGGCYLIEIEIEPSDGSSLDWLNHH